MQIVQQFIYLFVFLISILFVIYPVGFCLVSVSKTKLRSVEIISVSCVIGMLILVYTYLLLGGLGLLNIFPLVLLFSALSLLKYKKEVLLPWMVFVKDKLLTTIIIFGITVCGFISFPSGLMYKSGLLFWSSQAFDGFWHISLINSILQGIPPKVSIFSGYYLRDYHYFSDVVIAGFARLFPFFSKLDLNFRLFPFLFLFLLLLSTFSFVQRWRNRRAGLLSMLSIYLIGSLGYLFIYIKDGKLFGGETVFWASQLNTIVANPPHVVAMIILLTFLLSFIFLIDTKSRYWFLITLFLGFGIAGFKVSAGGVLLAGMGCASIYYLFKKRSAQLLILFVLLAVSNYIFLKLVASEGVSYLIFEPWWFIRVMVVEKLGLIDWELRRQHYLYVGRFTSYLRVAQLELTALIIFLFGNLGTRVIGVFYQVVSLLKKKVPFEEKVLQIALFGMFATGIIFPLLFLQKGIASNTIQFIQYSLLISGIFLALWIDKMMTKYSRKVVLYVFLLIILLLSVPTVIGNYVEFYSNGAMTVVSNEEMAALNYLKSVTTKNDIILTPPFDKYILGSDNKRPYPVSSWFSTAYVSALTGRLTYFSCEEMLRQMQYPLDQRIDFANGIFSASHNSDIANAEKIKQEKITYFYLPKIYFDKAKSFIEASYLEKVYENREVLIYRVK